MLARFPKLSMRRTVMSVRRIPGAIKLVVLGLILFACGGTAATTTTAAATTSTTAAATTTTAAETTTTAAEVEAALVGINVYGTFDVLDQALAGLVARMEELGYTEGENIEYDIQNPEFDEAANFTIAQQFADEGVDVMVGFATPPTQAMISVTEETPIVFVASSTPVESELIASMDAPGGNVTGVADLLPIEAEIDTMLAIAPDIATVGLIWTSGDVSGTNSKERAQAYLESLGIAIEEAPITGPEDTQQAAQSLVGRVDAIQLPCDSSTLAGVEAITSVATEAGIPVFGCTGEAVSKGALLAGAYNYTEVGAAAADLIDAILQGADPASTPVSVPEITGTELNLTVAGELGIEIPQDIIDAAVKTY
jgi:putative ABC transport system substrate-binding protein